MELSDKIHTLFFVRVYGRRSLWALKTRSYRLEWKRAGTIRVEYISKRTLRHVDFEEYYSCPQAATMPPLHAWHTRSRSNKTHRKPVRSPQCLDLMHRSVGMRDIFLREIYNKLSQGLILMVEDACTSCKGLQRPLLSVLKFKKYIRKKIL